MAIDGARERVGGETAGRVELFWLTERVRVPLLSATQSGGNLFLKLM